MEVTNASLRACAHASVHHPCDRCSLMRQPTATSPFPRPGVGSNSFPGTPRDCSQCSRNPQGGSRCLRWQAYVGSSSGHERRHRGRPGGVPQVGRQPNAHFPSTKGSPACSLAEGGSPHPATSSMTPRMASSARAMCACIPAVVVSVVRIGTALSPHPGTTVRGNVALLGPVRSPQDGTFAPKGLPCTPTGFV